MKPLLYKSTLIEPGGLMRCCTATIANFVDEHAEEPIEPGLILDCQYEKPGNSKVILDGTTANWRWNRE